MHPLKDGLRRRCAPRNDEVWDRITRSEAITGMAGLRRRCAPSNDGLGDLPIIIINN
ncbi:MAG: hypothetical protein HON78_01285 [Legionellales bacterium]|nr:hypothetical protein [Legionellales bacterium]